MNGLEALGDVLVDLGWLTVAALALGLVFTVRASAVFGSRELSASYRRGMRDLRQGRSKRFRSVDELLADLSEEEETR